MVFLCLEKYMAISDVLRSTAGKLASSPMTEVAGSLLLAGRGRTIMGLFADVTIEEKHKDELTITEHPTEVGSAISDHAYLEAPEVMIKVGWSGGAINLVATYEALQQLQRSTIPLIVSTGKRLYINMLIKSLACTTDVSCENVLMIEITFKKIQMVQSSEAMVPLENQKTPQQTAGVQQGGTVQPQPAEKSSVLSKISDAVGTFLNN